MATTFADDWSKAKTAFTSETRAKKPSASFLGVFNKGTGISASLKAADAAKNVGELHAAMKSFKTAFDDYVKTLDKAIADPKITDVAAKPAYSTAATKLKKELLDIYTRAGRVAETLVGSVKKAAVNPNDLKGGVEASQWEKLRPLVEKVRKEDRDRRNNRGELDKTTDYYVEQLGNRVAEIRPKGEVGGKIQDFLGDAKVKKLFDEGKALFETRQKNQEAYAANFKEVTRLYQGLPATYKDELKEAAEQKVFAPKTYAEAIEAELKKKPGKRAGDAHAEEVTEAMERLKVRPLIVKSADMAALEKKIIDACTLATKTTGRVPGRAANEACTGGLVHDGRHRESPHGRRERQSERDC